MYSFRVCELKTGRVLDEAPFEIEGSLSRILQGIGHGRLRLPIKDRSTPANWREMILPDRSLLLVLDERGGIVWHGIPKKRERRGTGLVGFPSETLESYFVDRYVPTLSFKQQDQAFIARTLAAVAGDAAGIPLQYDCPPTGVLRDHEYEDTENARVFDRLQELAAVEDGFDWTIDVDWADDTQKYVKYTFRTGYPHLGHRTDTPEHVFEMPGNVTAYEYTESAMVTQVEAHGDGDGLTKTHSAPLVDTVREAAGWPRRERREQFSGVKEQNTIDNHVHAMASRMFGGENVLTLTANIGKGAAALSDLTLGESAKAELKSAELDLDRVLTVVGWEITPSADEYKPTLAQMGVA